MPTPTGPQPHARDVLEPGRRYTMTEIRAAHKRANGHFFDRAMLRSFGSTILPTVYTGAHQWAFITHERDDFGAGWTIRAMHADGSIWTVSGYRIYGTVRQAQKAAMQYAAEH